jgi:glycosyltransferase involved in cell wall biosynthesis
MQILQVIPSLDVGGAERMVLLLARELATLGQDISVVSLFDPTSTWMEADLRAAGIPLYFLGKRPGLDLRMIPRLARLLQKLQPDIVHTHLHVLKYLLPAQLSWRRCRVVHTLHNLAEHEIERSGQLFQQVAFRSGVMPVAIGTAVAQSLRRVYHMEARHIIPNGIPVSQFQLPPETRSLLRQELGLSDDQVVFLSAGRLNRQKNQALLIDAFIAANLPNSCLLLAGEGDLRPSLEQKAAGAPVRFLGVRKDIPKLMAASDVFVLSSSWEGNPLVVMEAMASGLPVVATSVGCVPELLESGGGILVSDGDCKAMTEAFCQLASSPENRRDIGRTGAQEALRRFDTRTMANSYLALYQKLRRP